MPLLESNQQRAALLILIVAAAIAVAIWPYATGLVAIPVLYIIFAPVYHGLATTKIPSWIAALIVTILGALIILIPSITIAGLIFNEAQQVAAGVIKSPLLDRISQLRVGGFPVGPRLAEFGSQAVAWLGSSALGLLGTATRLTLNLTIAFFGLYYLLQSTGSSWHTVRPYIPFSASNAEKLRKRFNDVTVSTVIGLGLTAVMQGSLVGMGFWVAGLPNALFWSVVTMVCSILPVVGSGLVWVPATVVLVIEGRPVAGIGLALWGLLVVGSVDNLIRPLVYRRWAQIHPLLTLVGAFAGVRFFGILGLLIGPLMLSYFFELIRMYREEYLEADG